MQTKKKKSSKIVSVLLIVAMLAGVSLLLYPTVANWWNQRVQSGVIDRYRERVDSLSKEDYDRIFAEAEEYNRDWLKNISGRMVLTPAETERYNKMLNPGETEVIGFIEIPSISVELPVYHGTSEAVLQSGIGHLEWSSLPIGGEGMHSVLSGHRGLPSARLFTDLPRMVVGDYFVLHIMDRLYTYEVDQINIVDPDDTTKLVAEPGEDLCTLVTCTPYGVNSHRLLVRGHRIENEKAAAINRVAANAIPVSSIVVALFIGVPILVIMFFGALFYTGRSGKKKKEIKEAKRQIENAKEKDK